MNIWIAILVAAPLCGQLTAPVPGRAYHPSSTGAENVTGGVTRATFETQAIDQRWAALQHPDTAAPPAPTAAAAPTAPIAPNSLAAAPYGAVQQATFVAPVAAETTPADALAEPVAPVPPRIHEPRSENSDSPIINGSVAKAAGATEAGKASVESSDQPLPDWLADDPKSGAEPLNLTSMAIRMFIATVGVLVAAVVSVYLGRHWLDQRRPATVTGDRLRVVETRSLSPRASLQLVDAAGQMVLVGVDSQGIRGMVPLSGAFDDVWEEMGQTVETRGA